MTPFGIRKKLKSRLKKALGMEEAGQAASAPPVQPPPHMPPSEVPAGEGPSSPSIGAASKEKSQASVSKPKAVSKAGPKAKSSSKAAEGTKKKAASKTGAKTAKSKKATKSKKTTAKSKASKKSKAGKKGQTSTPRALEDGDTGKMWVQIAGLKPDELAPGAVRGTEVFGKKIALYKVDDDFFASPDGCPHAAGPLSGGELDGYEIHCPFHDFAFDVRDGNCVTGQDLALDVIATKVRDDRVFVEVSS